MKTHVKPAAGLSCLGVLAMALAGPLAAQPDGEAMLTAEETPAHGTYVADALGQALYVFTSDWQGQDESEAKSTCGEDCIEVWPPYTAELEPEAIEPLDPALVRHITRDDGRRQVTYNGWPLYYFINDEALGDTTGHGMHSFDGEWLLLSPQGDKLEP